MPEHGPLTVTVPGAVSGWWQLAFHWSERGFAAAFGAAIGLARDGVAVSRTLAEDLAAEAPRLLEDPGLAAVFSSGGRPLGEGDRLVQPALARTLETIAEAGPPSVYRGVIGLAIADHLSALGSAMRLEDLSAHEAELDSPLTLRYRDLDVSVPPPNSQGFVLLEALAAIERLGIDPDPLGPDAGALAEVFRVTSADRDRHNADPRHARVPVGTLLDEGHLAGLVDQVSERTGALPSPRTGDTIALVAADASGLGVALVQSLYDGFGSGILEPATGIVLHSRGSAFSLDPEHPNVLAGGKRPAHTLLPVVVHRDGRLVALAGTMGGGGQPQIDAMSLVRSFDLGMDPAAAVAAPRWLVGGMALGVQDRTLVAESRLPGATRDVLEAAGYAIDDGRGRGRGRRSRASPADARGRNARGGERSARRRRRRRPIACARDPALLPGRPVTTSGPGGDLRSLQALVNDVDAVVWEADSTTGRFTFVSEAAGRILGFPARAFIDEPDLWADRVHPEDRDVVLGTFLAQTAGPGEHDLEYRFRRGDGEIVRLRGIGHAIVDEHGRPRAVRGLMLDVTHRPAAEGATAPAIGRGPGLIAAAAHDLRTPLAAILGLALTLERHPLDEDDTREVAERIAANARTLDRMITDLLDLDRISHGRLEPALQTVDLGALVARVVRDCDVLAGLQVSVETEEVTVEVDLAKVRADRGGAARERRAPDALGRADPDRGAGRVRRGADRRRGPRPRRPGGRAPGDARPPEPLGRVRPVPRPADRARPRRRARRAARRPRLGARWRGRRERRSACGFRSARWPASASSGAQAAAPSCVSSLASQE